MVENIVEKKLEEAAASVNNVVNRLYCMRRFYSFENGRTIDQQSVLNDINGIIDYLEGRREEL